VGGGVPKKAPFKRAAHYDGVVPVHSKWPEPVTPELLKGALETVKSERGSLKDYDIIISGKTEGIDSEKDREKVECWMEAGVTWFLEDINGMRADIDELRVRIRAGPPAV
jgi:hypothetical protein